MRIMMISDHADPLAKIGSKESGGQNIYVMNLASFLAHAGLEVDVYTRWDRASKKEVVEVQPGFRVIRVKAGPRAYMPRDNFLEVIREFTTNIKARIERENLQYDSIFSNYWFSGIIGLKLAKSYRLPQVHVYHSIGKIRFETLKKQSEPSPEVCEFFAKRIKWEQKIAEQVTTIITTSPVEQAEIIKLFKVSIDKITCIPVGVDTRLFHPYPRAVVRKKVKVSPDVPLILYVGRLEWRKGIGTLLYAFKNLPERWDNAELLIVGGGPSKKTDGQDAQEYKRLVAMAKELGIENRVRFVGARSQKQIVAYYSAADVCVVPSYYEPFGIVPIEAMACGTPVVASRTGGLQFTVQDSITGYLAEPRNYRDLAQKIAVVLELGKESFGQAARERIKENFIWPKIADQTALCLSQLSSVEVVA